VPISKGTIKCQIKSQCHFFRVNLKNPAKLIKPKPPRIMAGSSSMKKGSGVYNLTTAYKAGGANSITVSIAKNRRIDLLGFKMTSDNGHRMVQRF
jgi:hypothetical protein